MLHLVVRQTSLLTKTNQLKKTMEKDKEKYLEALKNNKCELDERALGESIGFSKEYTDELIAGLLSDEKIEYSTNKACSYQVKQ
jgi:hypothetical protein